MKGTLLLPIAKASKLVTKQVLVMFTNYTETISHSTGKRSDIKLLILALDSLKDCREDQALSEAELECPLFASWRAYLSERC